MKQPRAQVLALGAVTMLVLALMMVISFSLTRAVHEKIRLQSHADAMTYSMATVGARAMNYYAYSNRATAAAAVSVMTLHAYHSQMTLVGSAMNAAWGAFAQISGWHAALFLSSCTPICTRWDDFRSMIEAGIIATRFLRESRDFYRRAQAREADFNRAVQAYSIMIDMVWTAQQSVTFHTINVLRGNDLDSIKTINAPCASQMPVAVGAMNVREFACALEGSPIDFMCIGGRAKSALVARGKVISGVANAARGEWPKGRTIPAPVLFHPQTLQRLMNGIQREGITLPAILSGSARTQNGTGAAECRGNNPNLPGLTACAVDQGLLTSFFRGTPPGIMPYSAEVFSNNNGGRHVQAQAHQGNHNQWRGFGRTDNIAACLTAGECFVNFRSDPRAAQDFGQPKVFGHFQQNLREGWRCTRGPWELGSNGRLTLNDGARGDVVLDFLPTEPGSVVSKSMIYFHRPDSWVFPPNAFDPYWKAKLHPMTNQEAATVLGAAGDGDGAAMARGGPLHGRARV
ncbi:MAG: hypothetical protein JNK82_17835 [Myxococcaceae bacterium]|nr:hypothetical protein [Myxococcaceae bacterium]